MKTTKLSRAVARFKFLVEKSDKTGTNYGFNNDVLLKALLADLNSKEFARYGRITERWLYTGYQDR